MFRGLKAFKGELDNFAKKVPRKGMVAIRKESRIWWKEVIKLTPVDSGFTRSEWKFTINTRPPSGIVRNPRSKGPYAIPSTPTFSKMQMDDKLFIYNNVAWIKELEQGSSNQAPRNFFNNSARRANYRLQKEFNRIKG